MMGLTPVQAQALRLIRQSFETRGMAPSYSELATSLGLASKSGVYRLMKGLEGRGRIRRLPGRSRAIELLGARPAAHILAQLQDLDGTELREVLAQTVGLLAHHDGVAETAIMLHRLGDQLPREAAA